MSHSQKDLGPESHTLLALVGGSPQIISESIYALYEQKNVHISEIKIITTAKYKAQVLETYSEVQDNGLTILENLAKDYNLPVLKVHSADILVPTDSSGTAISDVKTESEMNAVAQCLLDNVKHLTNDPQRSLHASLAGGRKTMTFYLSYAMSIFARPQDTLSHVFVSQHYENNDFFYPTPYSKKIISSKQIIDAQKGKVTLANIPYVQLRPSLPKRFLSSPITMKDTELVFDILNRPLSLKIDITRCELKCSGVTIQLTKANMAFYLIMLDDLLNGHEGFDCPTTADESLAVLYIEKRLKIEGIEHKLVNLTDAIEVVENKYLIFKDNEISGLKQGLKKSFFNDRKNKISDSLRAKLPENIAEHYDIDIISKVKKAGSTKPYNYFGLNIDKAVVRL